MTVFLTSEFERHDKYLPLMLKNKLPLAEQRKGVPDVHQKHPGKFTHHNNLSTCNLQTYLLSKCMNFLKWSFVVDSKNTEKTFSCSHILISHGTRVKKSITLVSIYSLHLYTMYVRNSRYLHVCAVILASDYCNWLPVFVRLCW